MTHTTLLVSALFTSCTGSEAPQGAAPLPIEAPAPRVARFMVPTNGLPV